MGFLIPRALTTWDSILRATYPGIPFSGLLTLEFHSLGYLPWDSILRRYLPGIPFRCRYLPWIPFPGLTVPWDSIPPGYLPSSPWATYPGIPIPRVLTDLPGFHSPGYLPLGFHSPGYLPWDSIPRLLTLEDSLISGLLTLDPFSGLLTWDSFSGYLPTGYFTLGFPFSGLLTLRIPFSGYLPWEFHFSRATLPLDSILRLLTQGFFLRATNYPGISIPRATYPGTSIPGLGYFTLGSISPGLTPGIPFPGLLTLDSILRGYYPWDSIPPGYLPWDSSVFSGLYLPWDSIHSFRGYLPWDSISPGYLPGIPFPQALPWDSIPGYLPGIPFSGYFPIGIPFYRATYPGIPFPARTYLGYPFPGYLPWDSSSPGYLPWGFHSPGYFTLGFLPGLLTLGFHFPPGYFTLGFHSPTLGYRLTWDSILRATYLGFPFSGLLTLGLPFSATYCTLRIIPSPGYLLTYLPWDSPGYFPGASAFERLRCRTQAQRQALAGAISVDSSFRARLASM
ncbi:putative proline-rich protein 2-like [Penaeus vannamei]|uniref:Putative proline-rich protein 2-like n=1 Tax=Penaeus vannamei TaxID=6689 RepID=A0A3R7M5P0_PENVA|nr:putative proline-rich protein 2-like [Penaeus vannamei]